MARKTSFYYSFFVLPADGVGGTFIQINPAFTYQTSTAANYSVSHPNDLSYSSTASGPNHFIDLLNFEAPTYHAPMPEEISKRRS